MTLRLPFRPPFSWAHFVDYLGRRSIPGVEAIDEHSYRRTFRTAIGSGSLTASGSGRLEVRPATSGDHLLLQVFATGTPDLIRIVERVRRVFDLAADPDQIAEDLGRDRRLR